MQFVQRTEGYDVYFDPESRVEARAVGLWPKKRIVVGAMWAKLPEPERTAVIYHEVGHCKAMHLERRVLMLVAAFAPALFMLPARLLIVGLATLFLWELAAWWARKSEYEADLFAAQHGHARALVSYLARPRPFDGSGDFYPSHSERIEALIRASQEEQPCSND